MSKNRSKSGLLCTCREDHVLRGEFIINNGELWQLYSVDPGHSAVSTSPVKLNIICCVAICRPKRNNVITKLWSLMQNGMQEC